MGVYMHLNKSRSGINNSLLIYHNTVKNIILSNIYYTCCLMMAALLLCSCKDETMLSTNTKQASALHCVLEKLYHNKTIKYMPIFGSAHNSFL